MPPTHVQRRHGAVMLNKRSEALFEAQAETHQRLISELRDEMIGMFNETRNAVNKVAAEVDALRVSRSLLNWFDVKIFMTS